LPLKEKFEATQNQNLLRMVSFQNIKI